MQQVIGQARLGVKSMAEDRRPARTNGATPSKLVHATRYGHTFALLVPKRMIPSHRREDVIEAMVTRTSDNMEFSLYTTHLPGYKRAYLNLFQLDARGGEEFSIRSVRIYRGEEFVKEFTSSRPVGFENTKMTWDGGPSITIDGVKFLLRRAKFRTYQGQVILDAELGRARAVKIAKSVRGFAFRLEDHSPVIGLRANAGGASLTYIRTGHDTYLHQRAIEKTGTRLPQFDRNWLTGSVRVVEKPAHLRGKFSLDVDDLLRRRIDELLASAPTMDEFRTLKGNVGEEIVAHVSPQLGLDVIVDHPLRVYGKTASRRPGPDFVVRETGTDRLCYMEVKWWSTPDEAREAAYEQGIRYVRKDPFFMGEMISATRVALIEWDVRSTRLQVHIS